MKIIKYTTQATNTKYSPHQQLPAPVPKDSLYLTRHFYENTSKHLIKDIVKIMMNGLHIDLDKVKDLEVVIVEQLEKVASGLANNTLIQDYLEVHYSNQILEYKEERATKLRSASYYTKPFNHKDMLHRSYFMNLYAASVGITLPTQEVIPGVPKWTVALVKKLDKPILNKLLEGKLAVTHPLIKQTQQELSQLKAKIYNKSFLAQIDKPLIDYPTFNPGSSKQKAELFAMLNIQSETTTAKGNPQWDRDQIVIVNKTSNIPEVVQLTQQIINYSYAGIIKSNFIKSFYNYTINSRLYGNLKLFGALTFRPTSSNPNLLQMPSTGSVFAKPVKACFTAPKGKVILASDYSSLEDRVLACLTADPGKLAIYRHGLDGHSYNSVQYYTEEISKYMTVTGDNVKDAKAFYKGEQEGNAGLKELRQRSKPVTFKCAYLGMPDDHKGGVITQELYNDYHTKAYPNIMKNVNDYIIPHAKKYGELHLGLGCNLKVDNVGKKFRTLNNAVNQFWSILILLTINKMHQLIESKGYQEDIKIVATIYDSVYAEATKDPVIIKWFNDTLIPIMETDFLPDPLLNNKADLEIGTSFSDLSVIPNNATMQQVQLAIDELDAT